MSLKDMLILKKRRFEIIFNHWYNFVADCYFLQPSITFQIIFKALMKHSWVLKLKRETRNDVTWRNDLNNSS